MNGRQWTKQELDDLTMMYGDYTANELKDYFGRSTSSIYNAALIAGLKKSEAFKISDKSQILRRNSSIGVPYRYKKGQSPTNKGKKQEEFMSVEAIERTKATRFQKGGIPLNHKAIGSTRITKDGYIEVKTAEPNKWRFQQHVNWEQKNGPIPKGMILACKTTDKQNVEAGNWELITRVENMKRNTYHNYPKEIANTIQLIGALTRQINKRTKNEKQDQ